MPFVFCFYGKIETGGYFIGTIQLLFGIFFLLESIYEVSGAEKEVIQFMSFGKFFFYENFQYLIFFYLFVVLLIGTIILIVPPIFLLYGTYKVRLNKKMNSLINFFFFNFLAKGKLSCSLVSVRCVGYLNWFAG